VHGVAAHAVGPAVVLTTGPAVARPAANLGAGAEGSFESPAFRARTSTFDLVRPSSSLDASAPFGRRPLAHGLPPSAAQAEEKRRQKEAAAQERQRRRDVSSHNLDITSQYAGYAAAGAGRALREGIPLMDPRTTAPGAPPATPPHHPLCQSTPTLPRPPLQVARLATLRRRRCGGVGPSG
jgi:hypothetical protein